MNNNMMLIGFQSDPDIVDGKGKILQRKYRFFFAEKSDWSYNLKKYMIYETKKNWKQVRFGWHSVNDLFSKIKDDERFFEFKTARKN